LATGAPPVDSKLPMSWRRSSKRLSTAFDSKRRSSFDPTQMLLHFDPSALRHLDDKVASMKTDLRAWFRRELAVSGVSIMLDILNAGVSVLSCGMYIAQQYMSADSDTYTLLENLDNRVFSIYFVLDLLLALFVSDKPLVFLRSMRTMVDILTLVPCALSFTPASGTGDAGVNGGLRLLRSLRLARIHRLANYFKTEIAQHTFRMLLGCVVLLVMSAGSIHLAETLDPVAVSYYEENYAEGKIPFHDVLYFVVVSITTVGYGDISPRSLGSKVITMLMILAMLIWLPTQTNRLVHLLSLQSEFARKDLSRSHRDHILICGDLTSGSEVSSLLGELFHPDHGAKAMFKRAVLLSNYFPSTEVRSVISLAQFESSVEYLEGNSMSDADLERASAEHADVVLMIIDKVTSNPDNSDASTMLEAMSIKRYVKRKTGRSVPIFMQLIKPENKENFTRWLEKFDQKTQQPEHVLLMATAPKLADQIICVEETKMHVMAASTQAPSISTFISNLVACSFMTDDGTSSLINESRWETEYLAGAAYESYDVQLDSSFTGRRFAEAASEVFAKTGVTLFGLQIHPPGMQLRVVLNPSTCIPDCVTCKVRGFVLARDSENAAQVINCLDFKPASGKKSRKASGSRESVSSKGPEWLKKYAESSENTPPGQQRTLKPKLTRPSLKSVGRAMANLENRQQMAKMQSVVRSAMTHRVANAAWDFHLDPDAQDAAMSMMQMYHLNTEPVNKADVTFNSISELEAAGVLKGKKPTLICGGIVHLYYIMLPLRGAHLADIEPVVVLHPDPIPEGIWKKVRYFPQLFFIQGCPLEPEDLLRAGSGRAASAIIMAGSKRVTMMSNSGVQVSDTTNLLDSDSIFVYQSISSANPSCNIVAEMIDVGNIPFMSTDDLHEKDQYYMEAAFAAGEVYNYAVLDKMLVNTYYGSNLAKPILWSHLIVGEDPVQAARWNFQNKVIHKTEAIVGSHMFQIPVPAECVGKQYEAAFEHLAAEGTVPLGLVRGVWPEQKNTGTKGNLRPYLYTNPTPDTTVESCDQMLVLCLNQPRRGAHSETERKMSKTPSAPLGHARRKSSMEGHVRAKQTSALLSQTLERQAREEKKPLETLEHRAEVLELLRDRNASSRTSSPRPSLPSSTRVLPLADADLLEQVQAVARRQAELEGSMGAQFREMAAKQDAQTQLIAELLELQRAPAPAPASRPAAQPPPMAVSKLRREDSAKRELPQLRQLRREDSVAGHLVITADDQVAML
jgi:hypothetical protein